MGLWLPQAPSGCLTENRLKGAEEQGDQLGEYTHSPGQRSQWLRPGWQKLSNSGYF